MKYSNTPNHRPFPPSKEDTNPHIPTLTPPSPPRNKFVPPVLHGPDSKCHIVSGEQWYNDNTFRFRILKMIESDSGVIIVKETNSGIGRIVEFIDNKLQRTINPDKQYLKLLSVLYSGRMEKYKVENE